MISPKNLIFMKIVVMVIYKVAVSSNKSQYQNYGIVLDVELPVGAGCAVALTVEGKQSAKNSLS